MSTAEENSTCQLDSTPLLSGKPLVSDYANSSDAARLKSNAPAVPSGDIARRHQPAGNMSPARAALPASAGKSSSSVRPMLMRYGSSVIAPFADDSGSARSVRDGLLAVTSVGAVLGIVMPKNAALPTPWYRLVSSMLGYTYFLAWSVSFYPQIISNYRRGSTVGLSTDFSTINHVGYICYTIYTTSFFWSQSIKESYKERYGPDARITVQSNDVAFALHAVVMSLVWVIQIIYYGGFKLQPLSSFIRCAIVGIAIVCTGAAILIMFGSNSLNWLDFLYLLSFVKVLITITKYVPQVLLNIRRRSTVGWSIWNVTLDVMGGSLSMLQLIFDSADMKDWSGITGNLAKLGLSVVTVTFDAIFFLQHYVLYRHHCDSDSEVLV